MPSLRNLELPENDKTASQIGVTVASPNLIYVKDMLGELHTIADTEGADMLAYLIEMAFIECGDIVAQSRPLNLGFQNKRNKTT